MSELPFPGSFVLPSVELEPLELSELSDREYREQHVDGDELHECCQCENWGSERCPECEDPLCEECFEESPDEDTAGWCRACLMLRDEERDRLRDEDDGFENDYRDGADV